MSLPKYLNLIQILTLNLTPKPNSGGLSPPPFPLSTIRRHLFSSILPSPPLHFPLIFISQPKRKKIQISTNPSVGNEEEDRRRKSGRAKSISAPHNRKYPSRFRCLPHRRLLDLSDSFVPVMLLHLGHMDHVVVSSPEAVKAVLKTHENNFPSKLQLLTLVSASEGESFNLSWR